MNTSKHTPQPWDLYRTPDGVHYLIITLWKQTGKVKYLDMAEGGWDCMGPDLMQRDTYLGNVLALPNLVDFAWVIVHTIDAIAAEQSAAGFDKVDTETLLASIMERLRGLHKKADTMLALAKPDETKKEG